MRVPDFFLVGAPKSGTTALYDMLGVHPDVFVSPIKEPDHFATDVVAAVPALASTAVTDWTDYLLLFQDAGAALAVGEGSTSYLASGVAAGHIRLRCPEARILVVLRDPADRLFAHYRAATVAGMFDGPFDDWLDRELQREPELPGPIGPVGAGRYATHLGRFLDVFSRDRIHLVWFDAFVRDPASVVRQTWAFLGLDPFREVIVAVRRNETRVPRRGVSPLLRRAARRVAAPWLPPTVSSRMRSWAYGADDRRMTPAERARAIAVYATEIRALARMIRHPLDEWTGPAG